MLFEEKFSNFKALKKMSEIYFVGSLKFYLKKKSQKETQIFFKIKAQLFFEKISDFLRRKFHIIFEQKPQICVEENLRFSMSEKSHIFSEETGPDFLWR